MKFNIIKFIYKRLVKEFFYLLYGRINYKPNSYENKNIQVNKINISKKISYKVYLVNKARVYTDRIHNFAVILKNNLIEGASYQFINNNLSNIKNNAVLEHGTPKFKKKINGKVLSLLSGGGANKNYYHWLFDVLPRIFLVSKKYKIKDINFFLLPSYQEHFQKDTLRLLGIQKDRVLESKYFRHFSCDTIISSDHPYRFSLNAKKDVENIPIWISKWLRKNFLKKKKITFFKKIYIDRRPKKIDKYGRSIINNIEVKSFLEKKGFKSIYLEDYSFLDQVNIFSNAQIIVGLHGAGFANIVFCKRKTAIIEIMSITTNNQIKNLANQNNLNYSNLIGDSVSKTLGQQGNLVISLNLLQNKLNKL